MQICILGFKGSHAADDAYADVLEREGEDNRWLLEVGTIARPRVGRVRVGLTFSDGETTTVHESDLSKATAELGGLTGYYLSTLAGPFGLMFVVTAGEAAGRSAAREADQRLFHVAEIKSALPRDSSALVLVADEDTCDALVEMFDSYTPRVVRHPVEPELHARLEALERRVQQTMPAEGVPMGL
jgi:hypothetical protein